MRPGLLLFLFGRVSSLLPLLILLCSGLLMLLRGGLLSWLFGRVVALLPLPLLILPRSGLFLLLRGVVLPLLFGRVVALLPLLILLSLRRLLLFRLCGPVLLLPFRLSLFLWFPWFGLLFLLLRLVFSCVCRETDSEEQNKGGWLNNSNPFHGVASDASTSAPITRHERRVHC